MLSNARKLLLMLLLVAVFGVLSIMATANTDVFSANEFIPGKPMLDTEGKPMVAMGGGFLIDHGVYYWFGEHKVNGGGDGGGHTLGVICYSSHDLYHWKNEGYVLSGFGAPTGPLAKYPLGERPKVIYNARSRKYVMWVHLEDDHYAAAISGVAVADRPTGPYTIVNILHDYGMNHDMTLFQDDDGKAYHIFSTDNNSVMAVTQLSDDYLSPNGKMVKCPFGGEAPAIFKYHGLYYMLRSECSGFDPNTSTYAIAESILGKWHAVKNPAVGPHSANTFQSQVTAVIPEIGMTDAFIFVADRWRESDLGTSTQFFLPITIKGPGDIAVYWYDRWNLSYFQRHITCQLAQLHAVNKKGEAQVHLRLRNTGKFVETGRVVLNADREPPASILRAVSYHFHLRPGATLQRTIKLSFPVGLTTLQAVDDDLSPSIHFVDELTVKSINSIISTSTSSRQINCGATAAAPFVEDAGYNGGSTSTTGNTISSAGVNNAAPGAVYQSCRYGTFAYVVNGLTASRAYTVRLHFAEFYWTSDGKRQFNVSINGKQVLTNFDIFATAGANTACLQEVSAVADRNGKITINFISGAADQPCVMGIEIL